MARSKRKSSDLGAESKQGQVKKSRMEQKDVGVLHDNSVFGELVNKAGLVLKVNNKPDELLQDQAVFQRNLTVALKRHPDYPQVLEEFVENLSKHIENPLRFKWSLMSSIVRLDSEASTRGGTQDGLMRLLLGVDKLQPLVMDLLLEKLAEFCGNEDSEPMFEDNEKVNMPRLILNQFRWLDTIINSKELVVKMLEIIGIANLDIQREVITCIPEVLDDCQHGDVAKQLRDLLLENNQLAVPILDALSNLTLNSDLLAEVRGSVMQTLSSVDLEDLPVIVKFLLQTVSQADAFEVVRDLRAHLDFESSIPPANASTPEADRSLQRTCNTKRSRSSEALTMDAVRSSVRFQRAVAEAWLKTIESVQVPSDQKVVDIFVLLILHSNNHKKPVESLFRNKIRSGHFTEVLLQAAFSSHVEVLRDYFPSILSIAEVLLRSPEPVISYFACAAYKQAFLAFDTYSQQEIVGNLVTHIGSGFVGEIDSSLDILADLVETNTAKMAPFAIFVKGVLDYLDNLSVGQIRKLYSMLSTLAFRNPRDEGMIQDEMHIVIRKQLSNNTPKYQRMGVIGAIMVVKSLAYQSIDQDHTMENPAPVSQITSEAYKQVINILQMVRASSAKSPEAAALFMDELAAVIKKGIVDSKVEAWINDNVISDFQDFYVVDLDPNEREGEDVLPMTYLYGLDDDSEGGIAINLLPLMTKSWDERKLPPGSRKSSSISTLCLSPHFRLLQICEKRQRGGDLEDIDALLGCPVLMPKIGVAEKLESLSQKEKEVFCESLFLAINWFREVVNAFATQNETEMKAKILSRLQHLTHLSELLQRCLPVVSNYIPPLANFDKEGAKTIKNPGPSGSGAKRGRKPGGKGKKGASTSTQQDPPSDEDSRDASMIDKDNTTQATKEKDGVASDKGVVDLNAYRQYFRELDLEVFTILKVGLITKTSLDTELNSGDTTTLQLHPPQLKFLLEDLVKKVEHSLIASASKRRSFLKTKAGSDCGFSHVDQLTPAHVAKMVVGLLPALAEHLEQTSAFFQVLIAANDGVLDGPGHNTEEARLMGMCLHLLLQVLLALFTWNGFVMSEHRNLLKEALGVLGTRVNPTAASQAGFQELLKQSFNYLENFSTTVFSLPAAVTLCRLLQVLSGMSEGHQLGEKIADISQTLLKREWFGADGEREKGAKHNEQLQLLLKIFFHHSDEVLLSLENVAAVGVPELLEADKNGCSNTYCTLTRNSYPVYYRTMLVQLVDAVKGISPGRQSDMDEVKMEKLLQWNLAVRIFHILVNLIKAFDARTNLGTVLKYGRQFVDIFLRQGMPMLDHMFRAHREDVQGLLKNLQLSTRALHHMCGHSKIVKDVALINQVPLVKKTLEAFVYRVKAMLTMNKCLEAFWLGNLKNRDLRGEEIVSQVSRADTNDDSDQESVRDGEEEEEEESEVEMDKGSEVSREDDSDESGIQSYSEAF